MCSVLSCVYFNCHFDFLSNSITFSLLQLAAAAAAAFAICCYRLCDKCEKCESKHTAIVNDVNSREQIKRNRT